MFRAFAHVYEKRHQELLQFIGKRFQILLVNRVCRILQTTFENRAFVFIYEKQNCRLDFSSSPSV